MQTVASSTEGFQLSRQEYERSHLLQDVIRDRIRDSKQKAITFSDFMNLVLYDPSYGYYTTAGKVVGEEGDFITAPELGKLFGKALAHKISNICQVFSSPPSLYEFGAGNGTLAVQIIEELRCLGVDIQGYEIVETSATLRRIQQNLIHRAEQQTRDQVRWLNSLPAFGIKGIIIANEVVDALPVELFLKANGELFQGYVVESNNGFKLDYKAEVQQDFESSFEALETSISIQPYYSELHCQAEAWMRTLAESLEYGSILISDYGFPEQEYYHPERSQGTLVCHRRHRLHYDPLAYIGCQDVTAHVNFSSLVRAAEEAELEVNGFTNLGSFMLDVGTSCGFLDNSVHVTDVDSGELSKLCQPHEMGEIFKVIEFTKNSDSTGLGFNLSDRAHRL